MGVVQLQILEPANGQKFPRINEPASGSVRMRGSVGAPGPVGLFFKWYSSLAAKPLGTTLDFTTTLRVGSHIVTFTAKDVEGDSTAELQSVQKAGMAGGPPTPKNQNPCVIHVFLANLREPAPDAPLRKASSLLSAEAPVWWDKREYQNINRIQYRWRFVPVGPPPERASADLKPSGDQLVFRAPQPEPADPPGNVPVVRYVGPLPAMLDTGKYALTLRVEDIEDGSTGSEVSINVMLLD